MNRTERMYKDLRRYRDSPERIDELWEEGKREAEFWHDTAHGQAQLLELADSQYDRVIRSRRWDGAMAIVLITAFIVSMINSN